MKHTNLFLKLLLPVLLVLPAAMLWAQAGSVPLKPRQGNARYGLINRAGDTLAPFEYTYMGAFNNGLARVNKGGTTNAEGLVTGGDWGYINQEGKEVIPLVYDRCWDFGEGKAAVFVYVATYKLVSGSADSKTTVTKEVTGPIRKKDLATTIAAGNKVDSFWVFIDSGGNFMRITIPMGDRDSLQQLYEEAIRLPYDHVWHLQNGLAKVNIGGKMDAYGYVSGGKFGLVDSTGREVVPLQYDYLWYPQNGMIKVAVHANKNKDEFFYGILDMSGKVLLEPKYARMSDISEGLVAYFDLPDVQQSYVQNIQRNPVQWTFLDSTGNRPFSLLDSINYKSVYLQPFQEGCAVIETKDWYQKDELEAAGWIRNKALEAPDIKPSSGFVCRDTTVSLQTWFAARGFREGLAAVQLEAPAATKTPTDSVPVSYTGPVRLWGYVDHSYTTVIPPRYEQVEDFQQGVARVSLGGLWGLIDRQGRPLTACIYESIGLFHEGLAPVRLEGEWGFVNLQGRAVITPRFETVGKFVDGIAWAKEDLKYGYIDTSGAYKIQNQFELARDFQGEVAVVAMDRRWGYVNERDSFVIRDNYSKARSFKEGLAAVANHNGAWKFIDANDKGITRRFLYSEVRDFSRGLAFVKNFDNKWGVINRQGIELITPRFDAATDFEKGVARVAVVDSSKVQPTLLWGFINDKGRQLTPFKYSEAPGFYDGVSRVKVDDLLGLVDSSGREIVAPVCIRIGELEDGLFKVTKAYGEPVYDSETNQQVYNDFGIGYVDQKGREVIPVKYQIILETEKGVILTWSPEENFGMYRKTTGAKILPVEVEVINNLQYDQNRNEYIWEQQTSVVRTGDKYGIIDRKGFLRVPIEYDHVWDYDENDIAKINTGGTLGGATGTVYGGKNGYFDRYGNLVVPPVYDEISFDKAEKLFRVSNEGLEGLIDLNGKLLVPLLYDRIYNFTNGRAIVVARSQKTGLIDLNGQLLIDTLYDNIRAWADGNFLLEQKALYGIADNYGDTLFVPEFESVQPFDGNWARIRQGGKAGLVSKTGQRIAPQYEETGNVRHGIIRAKKDGRWGYIDTTGNTVLPFVYEDAADFEDRFKVKKNGKWGIISRDGKKQTAFRYDKIDKQQGNVLLAVREGKYRILNSRWKEVGKKGYEKAFVTKDGNIKVGNATQWGLLDAAGKKITDIRYDKLWDYYEGFARVSRGGKWGFINRKGKEVVPVVYDELKSVPGGKLLAVSQNGNWGIYFDNNKKNTGLIYDTVEIYWSEKWVRVTVDTTPKKPVRYDAYGYKIYDYDYTARYGAWNFDGRYIPPEYVSLYLVNTKKGSVLHVAKDTCSVGRIEYSYVTPCKEGLIDWDGKIIIPPLYEDFYADLDRRPNLTVIYQNERYGIVDSLNNEVQPSKYLRMWFDNFSEGMLQVLSTTEYYGFIDSLSGRETIPCQYLQAENFKDGKAFVKVEEGKWILINKKNEWLISPAQGFDGVGETYSNGERQVRRGHKWGVCDKNGRVIIPVEFDFLIDYQNGYAVVNNGGAGPNDYQKLLGDSRNLKGGNWGILDTTGREIVPLSEEYDEAQLFNNGFAPVKKNGLWGWVDTSGSLVTTLQYDGFYGYREGLALVKKGAAYGFVDERGDVVIPLQYNDAHGFSEGFAAVYNGDRWGFIDKTGRKVVEFNYDRVEDFHSGLAKVNRLGRIKNIECFDLDFIDGGKSGYVDSTGTEIVPPEYDFATGFYGGSAIVKKGNRMEKLTYSPDKEAGKKIVAAPLNGYENLEYFSHSHVVAIKNGLYGLLDIGTGSETLRTVNFSYFTSDSYYHNNVATFYTGIGNFYVNTKGECVDNCYYNQ